jgi:hypothetical protein
MTSFAKAAGTTGILVALFGFVTPDVKAAQSHDGVREGQSRSTQLSAKASAITYWVRQADGWHVVTTIDTVIGGEGGAEQHAIARFSSVLLPGQSQLISVPSALGQKQQVLRIRRVNDQIEIARVPNLA